VAQALGVTERTVRNWVVKPLCNTGRRPRSKWERFVGLVRVYRAYLEQGAGRTGWRVVRRVLDERVSTRTIQESLRLLKEARRRRQRRYVLRNRLSVRVLAKDAVWTLDGTHVGRVEGEAVEAQVMSDRATLKTRGLSVGPPATSDDVLVLLRTSKREHGTLPLVLQTDGASVYQEGRVQEYLARERVVPLVSRPHMPTDNASAESGIGTIKESARLGKGVKLGSTFEAACRLAESALTIDSRRLRASRGYMCANELARSTLAWYTSVSRESFYRDATRAVHNAVQGTKTVRERRTKERCAVLTTLVRYGLVSLTRGGRPTDVPYVENIS